MIERQGHHARRRRRSATSTTTAPSSSRCRSTASAAAPSTPRSTTCATGSARPRSPAPCCSAATRACRCRCCPTERQAGSSLVEDTRDRPVAAAPVGPALPRRRCIRGGGARTMVAIGAGAGGGHCHGRALRESLGDFTDSTHQGGGVRARTATRLAWWLCAVAGDDGGAPGGRGAGGERPRCHPASPRRWSRRSRSSGSSARRSSGGSSPRTAPRTPTAGCGARSASAWA